MKHIIVFCCVFFQYCLAIDMNTIESRYLSDKEDIGENRKTMFRCKKMLDFDKESSDDYETFICDEIMVDSSEVSSFEPDNESLKSSRNESLDSVEGSENVPDDDHECINQALPRHFPEVRKNK